MPADVVGEIAAAVARRGVLLHGSTRGGVDLFVPRRQTDYRGRPVERVFATDDPIWALFFATTRRDVAQETRNACLCLPRARRLYYFSIVGDPGDAAADGFVYLLPRDSFVRESRLYPEWTSPQEVRPLAALAVAPDDFPYVGRIVRHRPGEGWLRFYARLLAHRAFGLRHVAPRPTPWAAPGRARGRDQE